MAHGHEPQPIPVVEYKVVDPSVLEPPDVNNQQAVSYGFNSGKQWSGADNDAEARYIRYLPPMEADLARQVEYDMDEQDQIWLDAVNRERTGQGIAPVPYETFEIIFDKLEKEWFDLSKAIPKKPSPAMEESVCAICDDGECENSNAIVFCDGCNLAVHQDCYGVPYIPEGQWLCRKCTVSPDKPVSCVLCPNSYGAFKQTTTAQWAHLLCAIWVPDTGVSNTVYMEPIDGVENITKSRWKLVCYLCRKRVGACIQCANRNCFSAFHVTCARDHGLELKMKQGTGAGGELKAYCEKHSEGYNPIEGSAAVQARKAARQASGHTSLRLTMGGGGGGHSIKSNRAYKKSYSSGPPLVPAYVYDRLTQYASKLKIVNKRDFMNLLCRYWSLKREARRGAPLLKRLHLEPWTASGTSHHQTEHEKAKKLELMRLVRNDLEKVRMLTEQVRKREKKKLDRVLLFKSWVDDFIFPKDKKMRDVLTRVAALDKQQFFAQPVTRSLAPDYHDIIKHPMDWSTMAEKLDRHEYLTAADFQADIELVISNARRYNKKESTVHRHAVRLREGAEEILAELDWLDEQTSDASVLKAQLGQLVTEEYLERLFEFKVEPVEKEQEKEREKEKVEVEKEKEKRSKGKGKGPASVGMRASRSRSSGGEKGKEKEKEDAMDVDGEAAPVEVPLAVDGQEMALEVAAGTVDAADTPEDHLHKNKRGRGADKKDDPPQRERKRRKKDEPAASTSTSAPVVDAAPAVEEGTEAAEAEKGDEEVVIRHGMRRELKEMEAQAGTPVVSSRANPREAARLRAEAEKGGATPSSAAAAVGKEKETPRARREKSRSKESRESDGSALKASGKKALTKEEEELTVEDVDPRASFKLFESGWVLPEGSSRRRSSTTEPPAIAAPTPIASTSRRGYTYEPIIESDPAEVTNAEVEVAVKTPAVKGSAAAAETPAVDSPVTHRKKTPVESHKKATPSISHRRGAAAAAREAAAREAKEQEEATRSKEEDASASAASADLKDEEPPAVVEGGRSARRSTAAARVTPKPSKPAAVAAEKGSSVKGKGKGKAVVEEDVEMPDAEPAASARKEEKPLPPAEAVARRYANYRKGPDRKPFYDWALQVEELESKVVVTESTELFDGLLVWARTPGHWPFPAEIADPNDPDTPRALVDSKPPRADHEELIPVMFFDDTRSGCWASRKELRLLGDCPEMDSLLCQWHTVNTINKHKSKPLNEKAAQPHVDDLEEAYEWAMNQAEGSEDEKEEEPKALVLGDKAVAKGRAKRASRSKGKRQK